MGLDYSDEDSWLTKPDDFKPGTYGCHEALHTVALIENLIANELEEHPAIVLKPHWKAEVEKALLIFRELYADIGAAHLK